MDGLKTGFIDKVGFDSHLFHFKEKKMSEPTSESLLNLWNIVKNYIEEQRIICSETIYQCDHVIENSYEFIEDCCDAVGYFEDEEE